MFALAIPRPGIVLGVLRVTREPFAEIQEAPREPLTAPPKKSHFLKKTVNLIQASDIQTHVLFLHRLGMLLSGPEA